jgi:helix-turn-helix protein
MADRDVVTVTEFAAALNVSHDTVSRWVKLGKVKGKKKGPFPAKNSPILIPASELERVKNLLNGESNGHAKSS